MEEVSRSPPIKTEEKWRRKFLTKTNKKGKKVIVGVKVEASEY
jgi:hypothetical protein